MGRVVHFEIHATNPKRAAAFYAAVFGWKIEKWDGAIEYWLIQTGDGPGIDGAIVARRGMVPTPGAPVNASVNTISVDSLDESIATLSSAGGAILGPREQIAGVGWCCYAVDTEGNIFGILQPV